MLTPPSSPPPTVTIEVDVGQPVVRIYFRGKVTAASMRGHADALQAVVSKLGSGFTLVTDLSDLREMEIDTIGEITRVMDLCLTAGVKKIVRVIPDPSKDIGFHLLSMTHYRGRVPIVIHATAAEAERELSKD